MQKKSKVLIADDHQILIDGLVTMLETETAFEVIAQARNGKEALDLAHQLSPDIILMDLDMPIMSGIVAAKAIKIQDPSIRIIILSLHAEKSVIKHMIQIGVDGYLIKNADRSELMKAIKEVAANRKYFSSEVTLSLSGLSENTAPLVSGANDLQEKLSLLSERETEVLKFIAQGFTNKEIGEQIHLSFRTVDVHRANLMKKLEINKVTGLVRFALKTGLID